MIRMSVEDQVGPTKMLQFAKVEVTLGRLPDNDVVLHGGKVSKRHASITYDPKSKSFAIVDHKSTNGVSVNGEKIDGQQTLEPGDKIDVGGCTIEVAIQPVSDSELAASEANDSRASKKRRPPRGADKEDWDEFPETMHDVQEAASGVGDRAAERPGKKQPTQPQPRPASRRPAAADPLDDLDDLLDDEPKPRAKRRPAKTGASADPALVELLRRYVDWDEQHRAGLYGESCSCGACLLCESRAIVKAAGAA